MSCSKKTFSDIGYFKNIRCLFVMNSIRVTNESYRSSHQIILYLVGANNYSPLQQNTVSNLSKNITFVKLNKKASSIFKEAPEFNLLKQSISRLKGRVGWTYSQQFQSPVRKATGTEWLQFPNNKSKCLCQ